MKPSTSSSSRRARKSPSTTKPPEPRALPWDLAVLARELARPEWPTGLRRRVRACLAEPTREWLAELLLAGRAAATARSGQPVC